MSRKLPLIGLLALILSAAPLHAQDKDSKKPVRPPTKQTQSLSPAVFKDFDEAQQALDAKDYVKATTALDRVKARQDKINDYEKATLYNLYAVIYYAQDQTQKAIEAYQQVLKTPNLPEGIKNSTLFALAQMYFVIEDYPKAIATLGEWFKQAEDPSADAWVLLAQAHYQQNDFKKAEQSILEGLKVARTKQQAPKENWLALLRAVYYELGDYDKTVRILELLVAQYPSESYYLQLSGMYGLQGNQKAQLATLHAAHEGGMVTGKSDLMNLARLYLVEEVPYPAVQIITQGLRSRTLEPNAETLQLYAQALALAKEYDAQIPVLKRLAEMTGESKHYTFLGQALAEAGTWDEAIAAFNKALGAKDLEDPNSIRMQLGTAQFNAGKLTEARRTFIAAVDSQKYGDTASNWIKFVGAEIERQKAMSATPQQQIQQQQNQEQEQQGEPQQESQAAATENA